MIGKFTVRQAQSEDGAEIRRLVTRAYGRAAEADLIDAIEKDGSALLQLVAISEDNLVGYVMIYGVGVFQRLGACGIGPMCVEPWVQREGIGRAMVDYTIRHLQGVGVSLVFVLGQPDYFSKFGFRASTTEPFETPAKGPDLLAVRLRAGPPMAGKLIFPPPFGIPRSA